MRIQKENKQTDSTNKKGVVAKAIHVSVIAKPIKEAIKGILLSNFETNQPEIGKPIKELMGIAKRMVPNCASLKLKNAFMVGIRDAQEAKQIPERKK